MPSSFSSDVSMWEGRVTWIMGGSGNHLEDDPDVWAEVKSKLLRVVVVVVQSF